MGFLAPWFLAGLAAIGLPLWLHLLRQHKSTPLPFSSLMFMEQRTQSSIKHRRLRYLMLLAARLLVLLFLILAFANPYFMTSALPGEGGDKLTVIAIDESFSMREGSRMETARSGAAGVVSSLRGSDRAQVLAFAAQVRLLTEVTSEAGELRAAIDSIQPSDSRSSYGELARVLRSIAQSSKTPLEVHLFSDMQRTSMPSGFSDLRLAGDTRLVLHTIGEAKPNWLVETVSAPRRIADPKKVRIAATIAGYGTPEATRTVSLVLNGKVLQSKSAQVPANGRASVEFVSIDAPYGFNRGEVRIDSADTLPGDDTFYFPMERADPRRILFVHEARQTRGILYYRAALESSVDSAFLLEPATSDQVANVSPERYAFVILSDVAHVPAPFEEALRKYVRTGGSVLVSIGPAAATRARVPVIDLEVIESRYSSRSGERFQMFGSGDTAHPALRKANQWENVKFYQAIRLDPADARIVARLTDKTPVLMEKQIGEGRVLVFASTFDNISNDFPLRPSFVPFVEQTAQYLSGVEDSAAVFPVDAFLELRKEDNERTAAIEVLGPDGKRALSLQEAATAQTLALSRAGFYEVQRGSGRNEMVAVNADRRESDLTPIPKESLDLWQGPASAAAASAGGMSGEIAERKPASLWWYVMLALLALAVAESLLGNRYLSVQKETA
ncbi:MAG: BatA domain-containing protein [Bryobacteraceae bacterium]